VSPLDDPDLTMMEIAAAIVTLRRIAGRCVSEQRKVAEPVRRANRTCSVPIAERTGPDRRCAGREFVARRKLARRMRDPTGALRSACSTFACFMLRPR
jgi:hypothetical protein